MVDESSGEHMPDNIQIVLRERPAGRVDEGCFETRSVAIADPDEGEVLIRTCWLGFDPAQRGRLNDIPSYVPPVAIDEVMRASGVGQIVASRNAKFAVGDLVVGTLGWQEYSTTDPGGPWLDLELIPPDIEDPKLMLNVLGTTGLTAYVGMHDIGRPTGGDTVLVTAAAGATGAVAGQIAKIMGAAKVIGTSSTPEKRAWVTEVIGFDECIDYRDPHVFRLLKAATGGSGFNVVFDNVGGSLLDNALGNMALGARVVLCGAISTGYRPERPAEGLRNYQFLTTLRAKMQGFIVTDHADRFAMIRSELKRWLTDGKLHSAEDVVEGLEHAPATLQRLFDGQNLGKQLLHVADPQLPRPGAG
jgi:NADPH-dependent curcumin reductase CurA